MVPEPEAPVGVPSRRLGTRVIAITLFLDEEHYCRVGNCWGMAEVLITHTKHEHHYKFYFPFSPLLEMLFCPGPPRPGLFLSGASDTDPKNSQPRGLGAALNSLWELREDKELF